ncbi:MAG: caspase family protein [Bryobacteraceae bacterium]|jgi:hypothetical protein
MAHRRPLLFPVALVLAVMPLHAERYAVLAGVSHYQQDGLNLEGPAYDIQALRDLLVHRQGYDAANVTVLLNEQATRENILNALRRRVDQLRAGDHLFFYFSGHGTSAFDKNNQSLRPVIGPDSGALAPYDLTFESLPAAVQSLIIGRRDLRPILSRVPPGAQALVALDSCYSENAAKSVGVWSTAPVRGINLVARVQEQNKQAGDAASADAARMPASGGVEGGAYPYSNVVSFAAASKDQAAVDIGSDFLMRKWPTVDGKPHGAFTNSLLAGLAGAGDTNRDGSITYDELFRFIRRDMEKYPHQPQILAAAGFALDQPVLGARAASLPESSVPMPAGDQAGSRIRVSLDRPSPELGAQLGAMADVEIVTGPYDLLVRPVGNQWGIYDASGVLVQSLPLQEVSAVASRVRAQGQLAQLRFWSNPAQDFNVKIDVELSAETGYDRLRSLFRIGERVKFRIGTERRAYLLLLGINKDGRVTVLFPGSQAGERGPQTPNQPVEFVVQVTPPAGSDQLKLIGFTAAPPQWPDWACTTATVCPEFGPGEPRMTSLMRMLRASVGTAETSLRVITEQ